MSNVINKEIEDYILRFPNEKFDNTALGTKLRQTEDADTSLYADVQNLWNRHRAINKDYEVLRKAAAEAIRDLENILEE